MSAYVSAAGAIHLADKAGSAGGKRAAVRCGGMSLKGDPHRADSHAASIGLAAGTSEISFRAGRAT